MKRNGRLIAGLVIVLLVMLCTACAADKTESNKTGTASGNSDKTNAGVSDKQRVIASLKGDITIPTEPQRVIGLSVVYPELLYALGVTPVAVQNYHQDFPSYLKEPFKDTLKMGIAQTPDFEAILASEPDLIIAPTWWADKDYTQLSKIAPTVLLPQRDNWRDELRDIADVLGKKDQAETVIQDLQLKETEAKKKLHTLVGDETVMYMMIMAKELVIYGENIDRGSFIHKQLGLKPVKDFPQSELSLSISLEVIPKYNPDHIILQLDDEASEEVQNRYKDMLNSSLWKNMTAVKKNQVYMMGGKEWFSLGMSPLADSYAIDDVVHAFENKQK
ncbi:ferrichrome ABC transporter substrate-binding protein [Paenibacillus baekrokdamisoli]|uniref:Ferrichrome ABC transporter substrate-binding protein n=1 Tax=Paenibacillus baekrokdamisoli TaxID=1712516 RepID=A0A3G9JM25_9BACL|nr:ABC transporter substrate-binding protein [Paenibacillus baekrokdamisoli]MBB3071938.1 iron complex transport system substrate-binding protein [Paenibacillus baekrokdamisoli]BBH24079.1 ferrichrome ABC transporter substrate-binding protein [Paenibacillus baekrokdamisoli]